MFLFIAAGVDGDADTDEVAPGTENLVAPGAESSVTSQVSFFQHASYVTR